MPPYARAAAALLLAGALLPVPAAAAAGDPPPLDVPAAVQALRTTQVVRAPGAVARFDEAAVLPRLPPDVRLLLAPPRPLGAEGSEYEAVEAPLSAFAREQDLRLLLVRGLSVQLDDGGVVVPTDLPGARRQLGHADVTSELLFGLAALEDPGHEDDDSEEPLAYVPADPALVAQVSDGLAATRRWVAPGVDADLGDGAREAAALPGLPLRVAVLPVLGVGEPDPDLLGPLAARFPGELVVLVRGSWLEAAGGDPRQVASARAYALGQYQRQLTERAVSPASLVAVFAERLGQLRAGEAFGRPRVQPVDARSLYARWAPRLAVAVALLLGGGSLLLALLRVGRRREQAVAAYRREVAEVLVDTARLGADVAAAAEGGGALAAAAERHATALGLLEQAQGSRDPEVLLAAADAVRQGREALDAVAA